jgi:two-component system alkaline phosphatase synthesis response regulator PhoP
MTDRQERVLVIEDEPVVLHTLELILQQHGYDVRGARDGKEALLIAPGFRPHTLLCDINLPDIDGIQVAIRLKQESPDCRVILLSGEIRSAELLEEAARRGFHFEVLAKPADPQHLLRVLAEEKSAPRSARGIHRVK